MHADPFPSRLAAAHDCIVCLGHWTLLFPPMSYQLLTTTCSLASASPSASVSVLKSVPSHVNTTTLVASSRLTRRRRRSPVHPCAASWTGPYPAHTLSTRSQERCVYCARTTVYQPPWSASHHPQTPRAPRLLCSTLCSSSCPTASVGHTWPDRRRPLRRPPSSLWEWPWWAVPSSQRGVRQGRQPG